MSLVFFRLTSTVTLGTENTFAPVCLLSLIKRTYPHDSQRNPATIINPRLPESRRAEKIISAESRTGKAQSWLLRSREHKNSSYRGNKQQVPVIGVRDGAKILSRTSRCKNLFFSQWFSLRKNYLDAKILLTWYRIQISGLEHAYEWIVRRIRVRK